MSTFFRILICGDRNWSLWKPLEQIISRIEQPAMVIHGDCRGADKMGGYLAHQRGLTVNVFPAEWEKYGKRAGPIRNIEMLEQGRPNLVIGFHEDIASSRGTNHTLRESAKRGIATFLHDGHRLTCYAKPDLKRQAASAPFAIESQPPPYSMEPLREYEAEVWGYQPPVEGWTEPDSGYDGPSNLFADGVYFDDEPLGLDIGREDVATFQLQIQELKNLWEA